MTSERLFKSIVVFFKLTNFLVMFQTMMNEILQDLINTEDMEIFTDKVIVETERKKEHNKIVEEVIKRLIKNNLYVKLKKKI